MCWEGAVVIGDIRTHFTLNCSYHKTWSISVVLPAQVVRMGAAAAVPAGSGRRRAGRAVVGAHLPPAGAAGALCTGVQASAACG